jgi:hypothetical protein
LFFAPSQTRLHRISQPVPSTKVETKTLTSNMRSTNWKTFIAARLDNTAGNKNTSVLVVARAKSRSTFSNVDCGPRHGPFHRRLQQKASSPSQLQECRRHSVSSGEVVNVPFRHRRNRNSFRSKSIDPHGRLQSSYSNNQ